MWILTPSRCMRQIFIGESKILIADRFRTKCAERSIELRKPERLQSPCFLLVFTEGEQVSRDLRNLSSKALLILTAMFLFANALTI